jgi:hypothetical protein
VGPQSAGLSSVAASSASSVHRIRRLVSTLGPAIPFVRALKCGIVCFAGPAGTAINLVGSVNLDTSVSGAGGEFDRITCVGYDTFLKVTNWSASEENQVQVAIDTVFGGVGINAGANGQAIDDFNCFYCATEVIGLTTRGTHNMVGNNVAPGYSVGQELQHGRRLRHLMTPTRWNQSPLIGNNTNAFKSLPHRSL